MRESDYSYTRLVGYLGKNFYGQGGFKIRVVAMEDGDNRGIVG